MKYKRKPEARVINRKDEDNPDNKGDADNSGGSEKNEASLGDSGFDEVPAAGVESSYSGRHDFFTRASSGLDVDEEKALSEFLSGDKDYGALPHPDVFNAYPPEVQRKIMEWTDRDVKARRDDESRRQDEMIRANVARERTKQIVPTVIIVLGILLAAITGIVTKNPVFSIAFLTIPLAVIIGLFVIGDKPGPKRGSKPK